MKKEKDYLYADDAKQVQISYAEYAGLVEKASIAQRCREKKEQVLADLVAFLEASPAVEKKRDTPKPESGFVKYTAPAPATKSEPTPAPAARPPKPSGRKVPAIKKDVADHFNKVDASGRQFNVFKHYYTCMNDACGGTVRVTIKDGICSVWNYDEWEEFAFIDIFDERLRIGVDSRYTDPLKSLDLCAVPRLLASRRSLVCVQVDDLNQKVLDVLVTAFNEVGAAA